MKNIIACSQDLSELPIKALSMDDFAYIISKHVGSAVENAGISICYRIAADFPLKMVSTGTEHACSSSQAEDLASRCTSYAILKNEPFIQTKEKNCFIMTFYENKQISMIVLLIAAKKQLLENEKKLINWYEYLRIEHSRMKQMHKTYTAAAGKERALVFTELRNSMRSRKSFQRWYIQKSHYETNTASDFADLLRCSDGAWLFYICDITAQPLDCICSLFITDSCMARAAEKIYPVNDVCRQIGCSVSSKNLQAYISLVCCFYNSEQKKLTAAGAGSCLLIYYNYDSGEIKKTVFGDPIGRTCAYSETVYSFDVKPGDIVCTCTDGTADRIKKNSLSSPADILGEIILKNFFGSAEYIAEKISSVLENAPSDTSDDWTFQIIKFE